MPIATRVKVVKTTVAEVTLSCSAEASDKLIAKRVSGKDEIEFKMTDGDGRVFASRDDVILYAEALLDMARG